MNILKEFAKNIIRPGMAYPGERDKFFGGSTLYQDGGACSACYAMIDIRLNNPAESKNKGRYEVAIDNGHGGQGGGYECYSGVDMKYCNTIAELLDICNQYRCYDGNNAWDNFEKLKRYMSRIISTPITSYEDFVRVYDSLSESEQKRIEEEFFSKYSNDDSDEWDENDFEEKSKSYTYSDRRSVYGITCILKDLLKFTNVDINKPNKDKTSVSTDDLESIPEDERNGLEVKIGSSRSCPFGSLFGCRPSWADNTFYVLKCSGVRCPRWFYDRYAPWDQNEGEESRYENVVE
jgi:hypothetical protein